jgi:aspartate carbamoyltransferase catalytic subunit
MLFLNYLICLQDLRRRAISFILSYAVVTCTSEGDSASQHTSQFVFRYFLQNLTRTQHQLPSTAAMQLDRLAIRTTQCDLL